MKNERDYAPSFAAFLDINEYPARAIPARTLKYSPNPTDTTLFIIPANGLSLPADKAAFKSKI